MRIRLSIYLVLIVGILQAQQRIPHREATYAFMNAEDSRLIKPGKAYHFDGFYEKLSELIFHGKGHVKIAHIGASHVQAGVWSWSLRRAFEEACNLHETAPGLLFPFSIAKTNHPYFYKSSYGGNWTHERILDKEIEHSIGLSGITGICADSICSFSFSFTDAAEIEKRSIRKVTVLHTQDDPSYIVRMKPESNVEHVYRDAQSGKTIFFLKEATDSLYFEAHRTKVQNPKPFELYGVLTENGRDGVEMYSIGVNGANTSSYFNADLFEEHFCDLDPDLVILSIGVNDAAGYQFAENRFTANYDELIRKIRTLHPQAAIIMTTNTDFYFRRTRLSPHAPKVRASMFSNAQKHGAAVWDLHRVMGGNRSINIWLNNRLAQSDRVHFTTAGYQLIAEELFNAIMRDFEDYLYKQSRK